MSSKLNGDIAIKVEGVGKCYHSYPNPASRLKQALVPKKRYYQENWALKDISFELSRGRALGIIGKNGAGKSTLLQIMTGTLTPTTGQVYMRGSIAALLELGSGFNPEFSGRENVYINGSILGLTRRQISDKFDEIVEFSELGDVINHPVKTYSSGMYIRLAFAVQICIDPDILIVDEALAVGDVFFQQKCHARMEKLLARGTSFLLVSHDISSIRKYCDTALLLEDGNNVHYGDVEIAASKYLFKRGGGRSDVSDMLLDKAAAAKAKENFLDKTAISDEDAIIGKLPGNWPEDSECIDISGKEIIGDKDAARFKSVALCGADGLKCTHFEQGQWAYFFWEIELLRNFQVPIGGLTIFTSSNIPIYCRRTLPSSNTDQVPVPTGSTVRFYTAVKTDIAVGNYIIKLSIAEMEVDVFRKSDYFSSIEYSNSTNSCIQMPNALSINIREDKNVSVPPFFGLVDLPNSHAIMIQQHG